MPGRTKGALGALVLVAVLAGCGIDGRGDDGDSSSTATSMAESRPDAPTGGDAGGGTGIDVDTVATVAPDVVADDRQVVYTASIALVVDDVAAATAQVRSLVAGSGGHLQDEQSSGSADSSRATLVLKVPPERFDAVLDGLDALGDETARNVNANDVTADVVDLEARIKSASASVDRTRALLAQAKDVGEIVVIEGELSKRETTFEQLLGQQRVLAASVALATISLDLSEPSPAVAAAAKDDDLPGPLDALEAGARSVVAVGSVALLAIAVALPWLPVVALGLAVAWLVRRRRAPGPAAP